MIRFVDVRNRGRRLSPATIGNSRPTSTGATNSDNLRSRHPFLDICRVIVVISGASSLGCTCSLPEVRDPAQSDGRR